ncbi:hypothetical protein [Faecalibacterium sp. OF04-11AC]|uniref:hypothetical protein n=1 Tax=Faecalibacterium sp. OF04-11AC TaxID=2293109 RepID=UPI001FA83668|nr:hypothetical protein [Faecalibacterium sp. OF04-11AC]
MESIQRYWKRTDKTYLLLCILSSSFAVLALSSWAAKQGSGFALDDVTGQIVGVGDYRRAWCRQARPPLGCVLQFCSQTSITGASSRCGQSTLPSPGAWCSPPCSSAM